MRRTPLRRRTPLWRNQRALKQAGARIVSSKPLRRKTRLRAKRRPVFRKRTKRDWGPMIEYAHRVGCQVREFGIVGPSGACRKPGMPHHIKKRSQGGADTLPANLTRGERGNILGACLDHHRMADERKLVIMWRGYGWTGYVGTVTIFNAGRSPHFLVPGVIWCSICRSGMWWEQNAWRCRCPETNPEGHIFGDADADAHLSDAGIE